LLHQNLTISAALKSRKIIGPQFFIALARICIYTFPVFVSKSVGCSGVVITFLRPQILVLRLRRNVQSKTSTVVINNNLMTEHQPHYHIKEKMTYLGG